LVLPETAVERSLAHFGGLFLDEPPEFYGVR
jgi:predicted ATPase with chaperone activity